MEIEIELQRQILSGKANAELYLMYLRLDCREGDGKVRPLDILNFMREMKFN